MDGNQERAAGFRLIFPKKQGRLAGSLVPVEGGPWVSAGIMQADGLTKRQKHDYKSTHSMQMLLYFFTFNTDTVVGFKGVF